MTVALDDQPIATRRRPAVIGRDASDLAELDALAGDSRADLQRRRGALGRDLAGALDGIRNAVVVLVEVGRAKRQRRRAQDKAAGDAGADADRRATLLELIGSVLGRIVRCRRSRSAAICPARH